MADDHGPDIAPSFNPSWIDTARAELEKVLGQIDPNTAAKMEDAAASRGNLKSSEVQQRAFSRLFCAARFLSEPRMPGAGDRRARRGGVAGSWP